MNGFTQAAPGGRLLRLLGISGASGLALMVGLAASAQAQTAPAPAAPQQTADSSQIESIVVTAQHKPEYEKDVPFAVSSLSASAVADVTAGGDDIRAIAARTPSLNAESSFGRAFPRFYIRGLGNSDYTYTAQQPVSVVYDDVAVNNLDPEILPGLGHRRSRSAARAARHAVRPQYAGRRGQDRFGQAERRFRRLCRYQLGHLQHGRFQRRPHWPDRQEPAGFPRLGAGRAARRLGHQRQPEYPVQ